MKIHIRKIGHKTLYRVEGSQVWSWSERQAIELYRAYAFKQ